MTRDIAIQLARQVLANKPFENLEIFSAARKERDNRGVWLIIFEVKEEPDVVISPGEIFVEVDEEMETAIVLPHM